MTEGSAGGSGADRPATGGDGATLGVALLQHAPTPLDPETSLARLEAAAREAAGAGADLLLVPEASLTGYNVAAADARRVALAAAGETLARIARICRAQRIGVLAAFAERAGDVLHNSAVLFDSEGRALARYRKCHLWGELDRALFVAGEALAPVATLAGWRVGILICYDVEFPEAVRRLALEGAELVAVPTALMAPWSFVAERLVPVRAFESGLFVAYANYCGSENGLDYEGRSCIVGPDGEALARAGTEPILLHARLERAAIARARAAAPYLADRRPALYRERGS